MLLYWVNYFYCFTCTVAHATARERESFVTTEETVNTALPGGLTTDEAARLAAEGKRNISKDRNGKSYLRIITDNLFTFFNMVWAIVAVLLVIFKSFGNLTFLFIIIPNVLISTFLEMRAKYTVGKLSMTTDPHARVVRDGALVTIPSSDVVLGDVMRLETGNQVLADAVVISGYAEANESMLTGESDAVKKGEGARVLAGSFIVSGAVFVRVLAVGNDNYIHKLEHAAKNFKKPQSDLFRDLGSLLKYIGIFMVPMTVLLFFCNRQALIRAGVPAGDILKNTVENTSGSVIGMIPAGIYLLVTLTLTLSVLKLARKRTLVQDMYSIEMLARADVLCLDKTGTITDGTMCVDGVIPAEGFDEEYIATVMAALEGAEESLNNTSRALIEKFGADRSCNILSRIPFSSERKYSAAEIEGLGSFTVGAPHFVPCALTEEQEAEISALARDGKRVLVLARHDTLDTEGTSVGLIAISDRIRPNAADTIAAFQSQDVRIKIISGDNAETVSTIAGRVGVIGYEKYVSCDGVDDGTLAQMAEEYTVFGRVTPEQKVLLVKTLKERGHTVAMTGDGVNDTLALKESNCSIAMADGSDVARKISQIVLQNSDFSTLPDIVNEGRRCINNVRQSASLFLMKTFFTIFLSLFTAATLSLYPLQPKSLFLLETFIIGIAAFLLALEPNNKRIEGSFLSSVMCKAIPNAIALFVPVLVLLILAKLGVISATECSAVATISITLTGFINLTFLCRPYTRWRAAVVGLTALMVVGASCFLFCCWNAIGLELTAAFERPLILTVTLLAGSAVCLFIQFFRRPLEHVIDRFFSWLTELGNKRKAKKTAK